MTDGIADLIPDMGDIEHGSICKEYPHLGQWELGQQLLRAEEIFMRKYAIPILEEAEDSEVEEVTLPSLGDVYRVRTLIPVINLCSYAPLTKWTRSRDMVRVTEIRSKDKSSTLSMYRPTREEIDPPMEVIPYDVVMRIIRETGTTPIPRCTKEPVLDPGPTHTLSTGQAIAWGSDRKLLLEPQLTFTLDYGERVEVPLYGETVLEVSHSPGPRGKDEDDDVLIQPVGIGTPPGYDVPTNFPNDPTRDRVKMSGFVGRAKGWQAT